MNTTVISFRVHKNLKSWLDYAGKGYESNGELLRLIVTKAAIEQASDTGVRKLLSDLRSKRENIATGDTKVFAVRITPAVDGLIKECATRRGQSTAEWCAHVLMDWWKYFHELDEKFKNSGDAWLSRHATEYRTYVTNISSVYAQKMAKQISEVKGK